MNKTFAPLRRARVAAAIIATAVSSFASLAQPALAWDKFGHEVIAQIAYDHMTPAAQAAANQLIGTLASDPAVVPLAAEYKPYNFVTAAAWQDDARSITRIWAPWHYIDLPSDPKLTAAQVAAYSDSSTSNVYQVLATYCIPTLKNAGAPAAVRARALGMFLHFAGDIHQPFHALGYEKGANGIPLSGLPSDDPQYGTDNLHAFWDGAYRFGVQNGKIVLNVVTQDLPRIKSPGDPAVAAVAHTIEASYLPTNPGLVADLDPANWALESQQAAVTFALPAATPPALTSDYVAKSHDLACSRMGLAGLRMAALLNAYLGGPTNPSAPAATALNTPIKLTRRRSQH